MESRRRKPIAPFYATAIFWIAYGLLLPLYRPLHYALAAILSIILFVVIDMLCRSGGVIGEVKQSSANTNANTSTNTTQSADAAQNAELQQVLQDGQSALDELKHLDDLIADPGISADIVRLEQISQQIFKAVQEDPKRLPQIHRFMDYYLPTTIKLLKSYARMCTTGISGENIQKTLAKVESMMHTIIAAFEKQLDSLYGSEAMDVATDISVLESMLAQEGLTGEQLKADSDENENPDIRLEL